MLGGAGLARRLDARLGEQGRDALVFSDHAAKGVAHDFKIPLVDVGLGDDLGLVADDRLARGVAHFLQKMRLHDLARRDAAVGHRDLDRRDLHVALADDHVGVVAARPRGVRGNVAPARRLPLGRGHKPLDLAADVDARPLPEIEPLDHLLDGGVGQVAALAFRCVEEALRDFVEHDVARVDDAAAEIEVPVAVVVPAPLRRSGVEAVPLARAVPRAAFREAVFQACKPGEGFEGGGSGVEARRHAVLKRRVRGVGVVDVVRFGGQPADPVCRVKRGVARQRDDAAVAHVHGHDRATDALSRTDNAVTRRDKARERLVGGVLDRAFDRQVHVRPASRLGLAHHVHDVALRIDGDDALPMVACEQIVVCALDARFAHVIG